MGWTSYHQTKSTKQEILDYYKDSKFEIIDLSCQGRENYAATRNNETGQIFAEVILTEFKDGQIYIKDMTENEGPLYWSCPKRILNKLTETSCETAKNWRKKCANKPRMPKYGEKFKLDFPLKFTDGIQRDTFTCMKYGKAGKRYVCEKTGIGVKITNLKNRQFEFI